MSTAHRGIARPRLHPDRPARRPASAWATSPAAGCSCSSTRRPARRAAPPRPAACATCADDIGDTVVLGISPDLPPKLEKFDAKHDLGFTLLSDPEHRRRRGLRRVGREEALRQGVHGHRPLVVPDRRPGPAGAGLVQDQPEGHAEQAAGRPGARRAVGRCGITAVVVSAGGGAVPLSSASRRASNSSSAFESAHWRPAAIAPIAMAIRTSQRSRWDPPSSRWWSRPCRQDRPGEPLESSSGPGGGMADAADSKSAVRKGVWVQVPPRARDPPPRSLQSCGFQISPRPETAPWSQFGHTRSAQSPASWLSGSTDGDGSKSAATCSAAPRSRPSVTWL